MLSYMLKTLVASKRSPTTGSLWFRVQGGACSQVFNLCKLAAQLTGYKMAQLAESPSSAQQLRVQQLKSQVLQVLVKAVLDEQPTLLCVTHDDLLAFAHDDAGHCDSDDRTLALLALLGHFFNLRPSASELLGGGASPSEQVMQLPAFVDLLLYNLLTPHELLLIMNIVRTKVRLSTLQYSTGRQLNGE